MRRRKKKKGRKTKATVEWNASGDAWCLTLTSESERELFVLGYLVGLACDKKPDRLEWTNTDTETTVRIKLDK
jgi:hypothetical protein